MIVVDASLIIDLLLQTAASRAIAERLSDSPLHAPELLDLEVIQALRRYRLSEGLPERRAREALEDLAALRIERHGHAVLRERIWELHQNLTAYDAAYVALAEALEAPLLTRDARLSRSRAHRADVQLVSS